MDHLDEMTRSGGATVEEAFLRGAFEFFPTWRRRDSSLTGCQSLEDRLQAFYRIFVATDHQAITTIDTPDSTARAGVQIVNPFPLE